MATWSTRRKSTYAAIGIALLVLGVGVPLFFTFYKAPTCFDGKKNGSETGIDCGGSCTKVCSSSFLVIPSPQWVRFKEIAPGTYNVAAYIINPNINGGASRVPYKLELLDKDGITISRSTGFLTIPPARNTLAFVSGVTAGLQKPVRATFAFTGEPDWVRASDPLTPIEIVSKDYKEEVGSSILSVVLSNRATTPISNLTVYSVLRDKDNNVIDFSKTALDEIPPRESREAPFTWPLSHDGKVISIEVLPVAE